MIKIIVIMMMRRMLAVVFVLLLMLLLFFVVEDDHDMQLADEMLRCVRRRLTRMLVKIIIMITTLDDENHISIDFSLVFLKWKDDDGGRWEGEERNTTPSTSTFLNAHRFK